MAQVNSVYISFLPSPLPLFFEGDTVINATLNILSLRYLWNIQVEIFSRQLDIHICKLKKEDLD